MDKFQTTLVSDGHTDARRHGHTNGKANHAKHAKQTWKQTKQITKQTCKAKQIKKKNIQTDKQKE